MLVVFLVSAIRSFLAGISLCVQEDHNFQHAKLKCTRETRVHFLF